MSTKTGFIALAFLAVAGAAPAATTPEVETAGPPPETVKAVCAGCAGNGIKLKGPNGVIVEFWIRDILPRGDKPEGPDVAFTKLPHGVMIGFIRVTGKFTDRRGYAVPEGVYGLRYTLYPNEPNHYYVAPQRDFLVLTSLDADRRIDENLSFNEIVGVSQKAARSSHPLCLGLSAVSGREKLDRQGDEDWVLRIRVEGEEIGVIVFGRHAV
jgi:hypothetical protein